MKIHAPRILLLAIGSCALVLSGCDKTTAGGSDEIDTRIAVNPSGIPVSGARIVVVPSGDSSGLAAAISATAANGTFPDFQVPDGYYSVLVQDSGDSLGKYMDSLRIVSHKVPSGRDTLRAMGRIRGVVRLGTGDSPSTVVVGLVGTGIVANVQADGTFSIELVPGGLYTLGASTSLQGYGPLYQRLQLRTGQDTLLADTLVLPFTALPAPSGLLVGEDTATGNVRVSWPRVVFPDLLGYVLERVEGGVVTDSLYTSDTSWTDSLCTYWNSQPLLGPWPSRNLAYRVRSRSVSGAPDSRSIAQTFVAQPPNWTKRVDSVKVTLVTDTATGVTTLTWNSPGNPDLVGWAVTRTVGGLVDCQTTPSGSNWSDSGCPLATRMVIDSSTSSTPFTLDRSTTLSFELSSIRRTGASEVVASISRRDSVVPLVDWRDSIPDGSKTGRLTFWNPPMDTCDDTAGTLCAGFGDSLWSVRKLDTATWRFKSRIGPNNWISRDIPSPSGVCSGSYDLSLFALHVDSGAPIFDCSWSGELWRWDGVGLRQIAYFPKVPNEWINGDWTMKDGGFYVVLGSASPGIAEIYRRAPSQTGFIQVAKISLTNPAMNTISVYGAFSTGEIVMVRSSVASGGSSTSDLSIRTADGRISVVPYPPGVVPSSGMVNPDIEIRGDEIWLVGMNGHLWKGTLHLPPS